MRAEQYRRQAKEHSLQVLVLLYLSLNAKKGVFAFAVPNAGKRSLWSANQMKEEGLRPGVADLCVMMHNGRTGWLEMKRARGRLTKEQAEFRDNCAALSHNYAVAYDLQDAIDALREWGALK